MPRPEPTRYLNFLWIYGWLAIWIFVCLPMEADAQGAYNQTTDGAISGATPCTAPLTRDIVVADRFTIGDVDLGFFATHSWRGDIDLRLTSPAGTTRRLLIPDTGGAGNVDNYNIVLDDEAAQRAQASAPGSTTIPPYDTSGTPGESLSAFDGEGSEGTWTLSICDAFPTADNGVFRDATLLLSPVAEPPAPALVCAPGLAAKRLAWEAPAATFGWPAGDLGPRSYDVDGDAIAVTLAGDTNRLRPRNGQATPVTTTSVGGTGAFALASQTDYTTTSEAITYTFDLGVPGEGFGGIQFDLYDVDMTPGAWQDRFEVTASLGGVPVTPTLTPTQNANYIDGNAFVGLSNVPSANTGGEGTVTINAPVDRLTITYRPGVRSPADPSVQVVAYSLIDFCPLPRAALEALKTVSVSNGGFAIPGADMTYSIVVTNPASSNATADDIALSDSLPDTLRFVSATPSGFTGGTVSAPAANADCAATPCEVALTGASLPAGATGELVIATQLK